MNKKGTSLCFFSAKGGTGKTTNLLNLAGIISQLEKKVLIIDFDLYSGCIAKYLNKTFDKGLIDLNDDLENKRYKSITDYVTKLNSNIDLLCAPLDPRQANKFNVRYVKDIINMSCLEYDVVLIDTNHSLDALNISILEAVEKILFVTTNDIMDLSNIKTLLTIFNKIGMDNYKILLNNSRDPYKASLDTFEIKKILGCNIDYTLSSDMFLKDLDKYVMEGKIMTLDKSFSSVMANDYVTFVTLATDILEEDKDE